MGVISKGLYENETFLKTSINGEFDFIKRPNTKSSKIACLLKTFFSKFTQATTGACEHEQNLAAEMGGMFIVPDVAVRANLQIMNINIRDTGPWETDWISITGVQRWALGGSQFVYFHT